MPVPDRSSLVERRPSCSERRRRTQRGHATGSHSGITRPSAALNCDLPLPQFQVLLVIARIVDRSRRLRLPGLPGLWLGRVHWPA